MRDHDDEARDEEMDDWQATKHHTDGLAWLVAAVFAVVLGLPLLLALCKGVEYMIRYYR